MKVLVTGAPGWLGSRLVEVLLEKGREVRCLVLPGMSASELEGMGAEIAWGDVTNPPSLKGAVKGVDVVYHAAGIIHPKSAKEFFLINRDGTRNMVEASLAARVKRFLYVSSNSAQGICPSRSVLMTEDMPARPISNYGKSKRQAERVVLDAHKSGGIEGVIVRPCWFYGPRQPDRMNRLMRMIKQGSPLLFGDGRNLRSMSYIDSLVQGLLLAESSKAAAGQLYWIADERPYETLEIYQTIAELLGVRLKPRKVPALASHLCERADSFLGSLGLYNINLHVAGEMVQDIACSIEKAKRELGYAPKVGLRDGLRRSIEWAQENRLL